MFLFRLVCLFLFLSGALNAQLREFSISEMPRPDIPVVQANSQYPDAALLLVYSSLKDLNFRSSLGGIHKLSYNSQSNRYEVLFSANRQIIFVYAPNFIEQRISTFNPDPKDIFYYRIEETTSLISKAKGTMNLQSDPEGCSIFINDLQLVNKTPFTQEIQAGANKVTLKKERYLDLDTLLELKPNQLNNFSLKLNPAWANLEIKAKPEQASVSLNNILQGASTVRFTGVDNGLSPGDYAIKVEAPKHRTVQRNISLVAGQSETLNIDLVTMQGELKISGSPENMEVYLNGKFAGTSPFIKNLEIGSYELELKKKGFKPARYSIALKDGDQKDINASLRNYSRVMRPIKLTKSIFGTVAIASALVGTYFVYDANTAYAAYKTTTSEADALRERVAFADMMYPIFFGAAALSIIPTITSAIKLKRLKKEWGLAAVPVRSGAGLAFTLRM
jgi:hypothetical protein